MIPAPTTHFVWRPNAERLGVTVGDQITFDIQGIPIEFEVTATRRIQWETMQMNFFLVAKGETLADAPQFRLAAGNQFTI